jgi:hypothetical protein
MKHLPDKYKAEPEKGKRSKPLNLTNVKVARRATEEEKLLRAPPEKEILTVKKYANPTELQILFIVATITFILIRLVHDEVWSKKARKEINPAFKTVIIKSCT